MSIIHEALKKAQQSLQKKTSAPDGPAITAGRPSRVGNGLFFLILFVIISAALSAGYMYWRARPVKTSVVSLTPPAAPPKNITPAPVEPVKTAVPPADTAPKPVVPRPSLKIQGIMADPRGNVALINDRVYAEGDDIDGAKIVKISLDSIVISRDGTEETLSARH